jgi:hypothetical protein
MVWAELLSPLTAEERLQNNPLSTPRRGSRTIPSPRWGEG